MNEALVATELNTILRTGNNYITVNNEATITAHPTQVEHLFRRNSRTIGPRNTRPIELIDDEV